MNMFIRPLEKSVGSLTGYLGNSRKALALRQEGSKALSQYVSFGRYLKDATKYERERYGKREFKGGSPLYPGKGSTIVAKESLLQQLKKKFGKGVHDNFKKIIFIYEKIHK